MGFDVVIVVLGSYASRALNIPKIFIVGKNAGRWI